MALWRGKTARTYQICDAYKHPRDKATDSGDVGEPVEDLGARARQIQERQEANRPGNQHRNPRHPVLGAASEDLGGLALARKRVQCTRPGIHPRVAGRPGGNQNGRVDNVVQSADTSILDANNEGTGAGARTTTVDTVKQFRVVVGNGDSDDQATQNVECEETVDETVRRFGDVATRRNGLASCSGDQLRREDEGEAGLDQGSPECQEAASVHIGDEVRLDECTWALPVPESESVMVGATTEEEDNTQDNETNDGDDLQ